MFNCFKSIFKNSKYVDIKIYRIICDFTLKYFLNKGVKNKLKECFSDMFDIKHPSIISETFKLSDDPMFIVNFIQTNADPPFYEIYVVRYISYFIKGYKDLIPGLKDIDFTEEKIDISFQKSYEYIQTLSSMTVEFCTRKLDKYNYSNY